MKVIIAGSRSVGDIRYIYSAVQASEYEITEVVSGMARGADLLGEQFAREQKIPIKQFPADWDGIGLSAGYRRNEEMAHYADALIAIWDGQSRGTQHMIDIAKKQKLKVFVLKLTPFKKESK